ncbi:17358_t:CDS:2, partial [Dentiscutata erythropus]
MAVGYLSHSLENLGDSALEHYLFKIAKARYLSNYSIVFEILEVLKDLLEKSNNKDETTSQDDKNATQEIKISIKLVDEIWNFYMPRD